MLSNSSSSALPSKATPAAASDRPHTASLTRGRDASPQRTPTRRLSLRELGADPQMETALLAAPGRPGRVVRVERGQVAHLGPDGEVLAVPARGLPLLPTVGDFATVDGEPEHPLVTAVLPRRSLLGRADASGRSDQQALAANVTHALLVVPMTAVHLGRLERMLTLVWPSGAQPVVVLSKADQAPSAAVGAEVVADVTAAAPGCEVLAVCARTGTGVAALRALAGPGATLAVLGASGAGKSTLANALAGAEVMATQDIRSDGKGRHTTVNRQLIPLPTGGVLIDTPGLRAVALWAGDEDGRERTFADLEDMAADCRFPDCAHVSEPGCAVLSAIDAGVLDARRLDSWRKLGRELSRQAMRQDARARHDAARAWRLSHQPQRPPRH